MRDKDSRQIRFGVFEVDLVAGELRKAGRPVRLQEQPFRILKCLLERPGELVTREELRKRIWGDDVYVDFDRSLNTAVARLREALGDSPTRPVCVETVPRKGYRLIAQLEARAVEPLPVHSARVQGWRGFRFGLIVAGVVLALLLPAVYLWPHGEQESSVVTPILPVRLTSYPGAEDEPTFSPDGSLFAFTWNGKQQDNYDIYVRTVAGGEPLRLTDHLNRETGPAWSPDGQWIAFGRRLDDGNVGIFRVSPLGGREEKLVEMPGWGGVSSSPGASLTWSPDSQNLAIVATTNGSDPHASIRLFNLDTGWVRPLTDVHGPFFPNFSPDGRSLAYISLGHGCFVLALSASLEPVGAPGNLGLGNHCLSPVWTIGGNRLVHLTSHAPGKTGQQQPEDGRQSL